MATSGIYAALFLICIHADVHSVGATCSSGLTNHAHSDTIDGASEAILGFSILLKDTLPAGAQN